MDPKEFDDPKVYDGLKDISNQRMDCYDPKEFDDPKGIHRLLQSKNLL